MFGKSDNQAFPGHKSGGGSFNTFVWRSIKKLILSIIILFMLAMNEFISNIDAMIKGTMTWNQVLLQSYAIAIDNGYTNFIPRLMGFFEHLVSRELGSAVVFNALPNVIIFLFTFIWVAFIADVLDMRKYEAVSFKWVFIMTFVVLIVLSMFGMGYHTMFSLIGGT